MVCTKRNPIAKKGWGGEIDKTLTAWSEGRTLAELSAVERSETEEKKKTRPNGRNTKSEENLLHRTQASKYLPALLHAPARPLSLGRRCVYMRKI